MGCLWPAFPCFLFFLLCPFQCIVRLCSSPQGLSWEVHPNHGPCEFRAAEPFNPGVQLPVAVAGPPEALSKSLQAAPSVQFARLGKHTVIANPIYWSYTLCSQVSLQKAGEGQAVHGMGEEKPWRTRGGGCLERRVSWANVSLCLPMLRLDPGEQDVERRCALDPSDPQVLAPLWWDGDTIPLCYFREHSHFSERWKSCLKPSKRSGLVLKLFCGSGCEWFSPAAANWKHSLQFDAGLISPWVPVVLPHHPNHLHLLPVFKN